MKIIIWKKLTLMIRRLGEQIRLETLVVLTVNSKN